MELHFAFFILFVLSYVLLGALASKKHRGIWTKDEQDVFHLLDTHMHTPRHQLSVISTSLHPCLPVCVCACERECQQMECDH